MEGKLYIFADSLFVQVLNTMSQFIFQIGLRNECDCNFVQSEARVVVPIRNVRANDSLFTVPQSVTWSNYRPYTMNECKCDYKTKVSVIESIGVSSLLETIYNSSDDANTYAQDEMSPSEDVVVSFHDEDRSVILTSVGEAIVNRLLESQGDPTKTEISHGQGKNQIKGNLSETNLKAPYFYIF